MKIRLRFGSRRVVVTEEEDATLADLRTSVADQFGITQFELSLNGRDVLEGLDKQLSDHGLVSGDLVQVLSDQEPSVAAAPTNKPHLLDGTSNTLQTIQQPSTSGQQQNDRPSHPIGKDGSSISQDQAQGPGWDAAQPSTSHNTESDGACAEEVPMDVESGLELDPETNRYLNEPMNIRESSQGKVPQSLVSLYSSNVPSTGHEALALVLHILMCEVGYHIQDEGNDRQDSSKLPTGWKKTAKYELNYTHPMCPDRTFRITMMPLASLLVIHGKVSGGSEVIQKQLQLDVKKYIVDVKSTAEETYFDLNKLSKSFKDSVAYPLLQDARDEMELPSQNSLTGLITEIKMLILAYLDFNSLAHLGEVNKEFSTLSRDPTLWRKLYLRRFAKRSDNQVEQDWFAHYRQRHLAVVEHRRMMRQRVPFMVPPIIDRPHPPLPPFAPVYPPGFIGGDFDLNPIPGHIGPIPRPLAPRPRFDPFGPLPNQRYPPGHGGGVWEGGGRRRGGGMGGFGPLFF